MSKQNQTVTSQQEKQNKSPNRPDVLSKQIQDQVTVTELSMGLIAATDDRSIQGQAAHLKDARFSPVQRQVMATQIGQTQGNHHLQRMIMSSQPIVQRQNHRVVSFPPVTIRSDPVEARRTFARMRESIQSYSDNALDYFSNQYFSAMISFQQWYADQDKADASFFNSVINLVMNTAWAFGTPVVGMIAAPIGSIVMIVAQEAARAIQSSRDEFADSLLQSANNFQSGIQRRLRGKVPDILERESPELWENIERNAYLGEEWQSLLHQQGGLPRPGEDYQQHLLSKMIFSYRRWELSTHSDTYRGVYSMADPDLRHMGGRSDAEAYIRSGQPIPQRLRQYARPGEAVASD